MVSVQTQSVAERARRLYDEQLRAALEGEHCGRFVAIEPESGEYFMDNTLDGAVRAARTRYPARTSHVVRVGHPAALHIGGAWS